MSNNHKSHCSPIQIVLVGDPDVGKTAVLYRLVFNNIHFAYETTVFETHITDITVDNVDCTLELHDTPGQEDYDRLRRLLAYPGAEVLIVLFSVISRASFANVEYNWLPELRHYLSHVPIILVGNKTDLREDKTTLDGLAKKCETPVTFSEGAEMAQRLKCFAYFETSMFDAESIRKVFARATELARIDKVRPKYFYR